MTAFVTTSSASVGWEYPFLSLSYIFFFFFFFFFLVLVLDYFTSTDLQYSVYTRQKISVDFTKYSQESLSTIGSKGQIFWVIMSFNLVKVLIFKCFQLTQPYHIVISKSVVQVDAR